MKTILSASRKEDMIKNIKRYEELQKILESGVYETTNLYKGNTISTFNKDNVGAVVLWSKDFSNFIKNPGILKNYNLYFQFTVTGYNKKIEPNVVHYEEAIEQMLQLVNMYSPEAINWRYDPIAFFDCMDKDPMKERLKTFEILCESISKIGIKRCTISFLSLYGSVEYRLNGLGIKYKILNEKEEVEFLKAMVSIADKYNIQLYSCASPSILKVPEIKKSACIDGEVLSKLYNIKFSKAKDGGQRKECGCVKSIDIGKYTPCPHSCAYCYGRI